MNAPDLEFRSITPTTPGWWGWDRYGYRSLEKALEEATRDGWRVRLVMGERVVMERERGGK